MPVALESLRDLFSGSTACFGIERTGGVGGWALSTATDASFHDSYRDHYAAHNILWRPMARAPAGTVFSDQSLMDKDAFRRTVFFNEWLAPQDAHASIGCKVIGERGMVGFFNIQRGRRHPDFGLADFETMRVLSPVLQRVARLACERAASALFERTVRSPGDGPWRMLIDSQGRLLQADPGLHDVLADCVDLECDSDRVAVFDPAFLAALRRCLLQGQDGAALLRRVDPLEPLQARLTAVRPRAGAERMLAGEELALIVLAAVGSAERRLKARLREDYGLTVAETAVVLEIVKGDGKAAAAARLGVSYATTRSHLAHVFSKMAVRRQAELVSLVSRLGADA